MTLSHPKARVLAHFRHRLRGEARHRQHRLHRRRRKKGGVGLHRRKKAKSERGVVQQVEVLSAEVLSAAVPGAVAVAVVVVAKVAVVVLPGMTTITTTILQP